MGISSNLRHRDRRQRAVRQPTTATSFMTDEDCSEPPPSFGATGAPHTSRRLTQVAVMPASTRTSAMVCGRLFKGGYIFFPCFSTVPSLSLDLWAAAVSAASVAHIANAYIRPTRHWRRSTREL